MAEYQYVAYDNTKKLIKGTQRATNAEVARSMLASKGYSVLSLKTVPSFMPSGKLFRGLVTSKVSADTIVLFSRQMALLLESGTPMVNALELLMRQTTNRRLRNVLTEMISDLRKGQHLSQAMSKHTDVFNKMYVQSVVVGEQSGSLESVLREVSDHLERESSEAKDIKAALMYPAILAVVAVIVVAILGFFVLPTFADLYSQLGLQLPLLTRMLFGFANWFREWGLYVMLALLIVAVGLVAWSRTARGKLVIDRNLLRMPIFGRIILLSELSRCCRSMSILHRTGLSVSETMILVMEASKNAIIQRALSQVHQDVLRGMQIGASMAKNPVFLPMMVQMISVGESTGTLDVTLTATADSYEAELSNRMRAMIGLIQPVFTVVLAVVVGIIAIAMVQAMYSMYGQLDQAGI
jgi:type IV pilus assembly protein PilC